MDYSKSGNPKLAKGSHNHRAQDLDRQNAPKEKAKDNKAELLARMKAAAEARKAQE